MFGVDGASLQEGMATASRRQIAPLEVAERTRLLPLVPAEVHATRRTAGRSAEPLVQLPEIKGLLEAAPGFEPGRTPVDPTTYGESFETIGGSSTGSRCLGPPE